MIQSPREQGPGDQLGRTEARTKARWRKGQGEGWVEGQGQDEAEDRDIDGGKAFIIPSIHWSGDVKEPALVHSSQEGQMHDKGNGGNLHEVGLKEHASNEQLMIT